MEMTAYGPSFIGGTGFRLERSDLLSSDGPAPLDLAEAFIDEYGILWGVSYAQDILKLDKQEADPLGWTHIRFEQVYNGLAVDGGGLTFHIDGVPSIRSIDGMLVPVPPFLSTTPIVSESEARVSAEASVPGSSSHCAKLLVYVPYLNSLKGDLMLAWRIKLVDENNAITHEVMVDATDGRILDIVHLIKYSMDRFVWNNRGDEYESQGCCGPVCCVGDPCTTGHGETCTLDGNFFPDVPAYSAGHPYCPADPNCEDIIWVYLEGSDCAGDPPTGKPDCMDDMRLLWDYTANVWEYWNLHFYGRDSWDNAGRPMWSRGNVLGLGTAFGSTTEYAVASDPGDCDSCCAVCNRKYNLIAANFKPRTPDSPLPLWLVGHEYGHALRSWEVEEMGGIFYGQFAALDESDADINGYLVDEEVADYFYPGGCLVNHGHWRYYYSASTPLNQSLNHYIGRCSATLLGQTSTDDDGNPSNGYQKTYHGVQTTNIPLDQFEKIWYLALVYYTDQAETYHGRRRDMVYVAQALYGTGENAPVYQVANAMDAIGTWTSEYVITADPLVQSARPAAAVATNAGQTRSYVFYRKTPETDRTIYHKYITPGGSWSSEFALNDPDVDPIENEPSAAVRQYGSSQQIWVVWRNQKTNQIVGRYIYYSSYPRPGWFKSASITFNAYTIDTPAVSCLNIGTANERIYIAFRDQSSPTQLYYVYFDSSPGSSPTSLGSSYRTDVAPSLATYGAGATKRLYLFFTGVEPDDDVYYGSYLYGSSWSSKTNVTSLYNAVTQNPSGITRTEKPVSLAAYGITQTRLHAASVARDTDELWMYALYETSPGVLNPSGQWAVPQRTPSYGGTTAGAFGVYQDRLFHFFIENSVLYWWSQRSD